MRHGQDYLTGVNFINNLRTNFRMKFWRQKFQTQNTAFVQNFGAINPLLYEKGMLKMLMKLLTLVSSPGVHMNTFSNFS